MRRAGRRRWVGARLAVIGLVGVVGGAAADRAQHARRRGASGSSAAGPGGARRGVPRRLARRRLRRHVRARRARRAGLDLISPVRSRVPRTCARTASMTGLRAAGRLRATAGAWRRCRCRSRRRSSDASRRQLEIPLVRRAQDLPGRLDAGADVPRAAARRDAHAQGARTGEPRAASWPATGPCSPRARPATAPIRPGRRSRSSPGSRKLAGGSGDRRPPQGSVGRRGRKYGQGGPRGVARRRPGRPSPRAAGGGAVGPREPGPDPGPKAGAEAEGRRDDDRPRHPGSVGHGARVPLRRDRRARSAHGRGAGGRRARHGRHPAAGIVVQDRDRLGRADRRDGRADRHVPVREVRRPERLAPSELPPRAVRRVVRAGVRRQLQLGVRSRGRRGRGEAARGDGARVRLQRAPDDRLSRPREHHPEARPDALRSVARRRRNRPGRSHREPAPDGVRRPDDRVARHAPARRSSCTARARRRTGRIPSASSDGVSPARSPR